MKKARAAFWDSSAVVPLCCKEEYSSLSHRYSRIFSKMVVWWNTPVEMHSAFQRLLREGSITQGGFKLAFDLAQRLRERWFEVMPMERVRDLAQECLDQHVLRAGDALQLAAALFWCREKPKKRPFVCFDPGLAKAAEQRGFDIYTIVL